MVRCQWLVSRCFVLYITRRFGRVSEGLWAEWRVEKLQTGVRYGKLQKLQVAHGNILFLKQHS